jgi:hypothetical protein
LIACKSCRHHANLVNFITSAVCTEIKVAKSELKMLKEKQQHSDSLKKRSKCNHWIEDMESKLALLNEIRIK